MHRVRLLASCIVAIGLFGLLGWVLGVDWMTRILAGEVTMKFATSIAMILAGTALWFASRREPVSQLIAAGCAIALVLHMGAIAFDSLADRQSGMAWIGGHEQVDAIKTIVPGEPSVGTMLAFLSIAAWTILRVEKQSARWLGYGVFVIAAGVLAGYVIGSDALKWYWPGRSSAVAVHTAAGLILSGIAMVVMDHEEIG